MNIYEIYVKFQKMFLQYWSLYCHNLLFYFFKEKNSSLNPFTDFTLSAWLVACLLMYSLNLLVDVPTSFSKFGQM